MTVRASEALSIFAVPDGGHSLQYFVDTVQRRPTPLDEVRHPPQRHHGPGQQPQIADKRDKISRRNDLHNGLPSAQVKHNGQA